MQDMSMSMSDSMGSTTTGQSAHHGAGAATSWTFSVQVDIFGLVTGGWSQYCIAFVCVLGLSIAYESLLFAKQQCHRYFAHVGPDTDRKTQLKFKLYMTGLHVLTAMLHYTLMLIVMTFNFGVAVSVLIGVAIGYSIFLEYPNKRYRKVQISENEKVKEIEFGADHCRSTPYAAEINNTDTKIFTLQDDEENDDELNSRL